MFAGLKFEYLSILFTPKSESFFTNGLDVIYIGVFADLLSQITDIHVYIISLSIKMDIPNFFSELFLSDDPVTILHKVNQEIKFIIRKLNFLIFNGTFTLKEIYFEFLACQLLFSSGFRSAIDGRHTRD